MALSNGYSLSTAAEFFKRVYQNSDLSPLALRRTPTLRAVKKEEESEGQGLQRPINFSMPVGASGTASSAVTYAYGSRGKVWQLSTKNIYMRVNIDAKAMANSRVKTASYLEAKRKETDEALSYMGMRAEQMLWDDGSGFMGQVDVDASNPATEMTLAQPLDAINFHQNQVLQFNDDRTGAGTPRTDKYRVDTINDITGVLGVTRVSGSADDVADGDYAFIEGNRANVLTGITAYLPASDPGVGGVPAALNNVTRTDRPVFLSGWRGDNEGSIEESSKSLWAKMGRYLNSADSTLWLSYSNWRKLEQELGSRAYRDEKASARFGTGAIIMQTPAGDVPCVAGPYVPETAGFLLDLSQCSLIHTKELFHLRNEDGLGAVRLDWASDEDGIGIEFRSWLEFCIDRPMTCGRFPIS